MMLEWEDAICPICQEHPHNGVLLWCSSFERGCRTFMCNTSSRHSNCLDRFCRLSVSCPSSALLQDIPLGNMISTSLNWRDPSPEYEIEAGNDLQPRLLCPHCRGEIYGWNVFEPAREFMNSKARSCSSETCDVSGTYSELRKHARSDHPLVRPTEVDPERQRDWTRLERERDYEDMRSSIQPVAGEESNGESISDLEDSSWEESNGESISHLEDFSSLTRDLAHFSDQPMMSEWQDARCPICMEHPHNAVLLWCSCFERGCRTFMCNTSSRHSNCLDRFCRLSVSCPSSALLQDIPLGNMISTSLNWRDPSPEYEIEAGNDLQPKLLCPHCRGEIYGWNVFEPAREFMNSKARSCSSETCDFSGTYSELREHARSDHPLVRPTEVDPDRQCDWTRLERERDYEDMRSSIQPVAGEESNGESISDLEDFSSLTRDLAYFSNQPMTSEWQDARCPICMEHPHNAVLLWCSSFEKGCRTFMWNTSSRHSNCLDRFCRLSVSCPSSALLQDIPLGNMISTSLNWRDPSPEYEIEAGNDLQPRLLCPHCRGEIYGWNVFEPAREFMNSKARSCSSQTCDFSGTYSELREHARSDHALVRPTEVDLERQRDWTRLERERDYEDMRSSIQPVAGEESNGESISDLEDTSWEESNGESISDLEAFSWLIINLAYLTLALEDIRDSRNTE